MASLIFPDGRLCSLPIPSLDEPCTYSRISFGKEKLGRIVEGLTKGRIARDRDAHLDPDLYRNPLHRIGGWLPAFGPSERAQAHLAKHGVGKGDVFLFFGWFRKARKDKCLYRFESGAPDLHVVFGWLQVGAVFHPFDSKSALPDWASCHPHFSRGQEWHDPDGCEKKKAIYVATKRLKVPGLRKNISGGGVFKGYHDALCLSAPGQKLRSHWRLPRWMYPFPDRQPLTYHGGRAKWHRDEKWAYLNAVDRGQEFVLHAEDYPEAEKWLVGLFNKAF